MLQTEQHRGAPAMVGSARAADIMVAGIERDIISGKLDDGSYLPAERELMALYGVGRGVVREAIARLASRGLVEARPRFRPVARRPGLDTALGALEGMVGHLLVDKAGVKTLYDMRVFLEAALARSAAISARKDDVAALRAALAVNEAAIPDSENFYATDVAFHAVLYDIARNPVLPAVHKAFTAWLSPHWLRMPRSPERNRVNFLSHRDICAAIIERDPDGAERALLNHLASAWEYVRGTFETPDGQEG
ncbi:FCD domain-containing protein [Mesorhizobium sp. CO1-1-7]|uniref:FCD domain-containing protein n=1 Tax=unclassified Mesorhizobium TaxID=325217 RepID=UPI001CCE6D9D|nr:MULTISPECIES: FCD domain-containing protein [unclassified Mesorhizobium]MBZ9747783.1 FCD domain-containing protein [Mesorhizobium sp. CO1-1-7]MBZ9905444.1 FCD domain-containing protein [Mesorhizobium sp. BR115XR7A]MBZ9929606.1 FCD domain-containing protein [Mesorhizobium sp. BR1-1-5]